MLSCELCCSFRAVRLLCLILLQQGSLKKNFFSQMLFVGGFGLYIWMSVEVSCPARRQSSPSLPAEASPCCCEARRLRAGSDFLLWSPPHPEAESLCCSGLPRQWQAASAVGVYLSRDGLPWQRLAASAVGMYLSWGGLPWWWWTPLPHRASRTVCSG